MKILKHIKIDKEFNFDSKNNFTLCIENQIFFRSFIYSLKNQINEDLNNDFMLLDNNKEIKLSKVAFLIENPLFINIDDKKINLAIQKDLSSKISLPQKEEYKILQNEIFKYVSNIILDYPLPLTYDNDLPILNLLKLLSLQIDDKCESFLENMILKIKTISFLLNIKLFFFINLHDYLTQEEFKLFTNELKSLEISALYITNHYPNYKNNEEFIVRIDYDLCELHIE